MLVARREAVAYARHEGLFHHMNFTNILMQRHELEAGASQVSGANYGYKPSLGQYSIYNKTFGYLTGKGFCYKGKCRVYAGILDEFG